MAPVLSYLEYTLGKSLSPIRGHDAKLFTRGPAFAHLPNPTIEITSPDCGASGSTLTQEYTQYGADRFPGLEWTLPPELSGAREEGGRGEGGVGGGGGVGLGEVKEYLLVIEDPDAPLPWPPSHGLFYGIPASTTHITAHDVTLKNKNPNPKATHNNHSKKTRSLEINGPFKASKNIGGTHYGGPRPPLGHGEHRYFFQLVALGEELDFGVGEVPTKKELAEKVDGRVVGWGVWVGVFERVWS